jgi:hypothetical protein
MSTPYQGNGVQRADRLARATASKISRVSKRRAVTAVIVAAIAGLAPALLAADRAVVWVRAGDADFERDLNTQASRGLRLAAISDGLPCAVAALQAPERPAPPVAYRVVREGDLARALPGLVAEGFVPTASARTFGTRHQVVFERSTPVAVDGEWRVVEFDKLEDIDGALSAAAADGFRARVLVRLPYRSFPGLSEKGLILASRAPDAPAFATRVLIGTKSDLKDVIAPVAAATKDGWNLDVMGTSARDGSRDRRRERIVLALSRGASPTTAARPITLERSLFGMIGSGIPVAAGLFWDAYAFAWTPADRRQIWASPIRLSDTDAQCAGLELRMRLHAPRDQRSTIVALVGRPLTTGGYELVVVTEDRFGGA